MSKEESKAFLKELGELCTKYHVNLHGDEMGDVYVIDIDKDSTVTVLAHEGGNEKYPMLDLCFSIEKPVAVS